MTVPRIIRESIAAGMPPIREVPSPDGRFALGEMGAQLALRTEADGRLRALTEDGLDDFRWDVEQAMWAPSGPWVAAHKIDLHQVPDRPWLDLDRVALTGASWGGYMAVRGLLLEP